MRKANKNYLKILIVNLASFRANCLFIVTKTRRNWCRGLFSHYSWKVRAIFPDFIKSSMNGFPSPICWVYTWERNLVNRFYPIIVFFTSFLVFAHDCNCILSAILEGYIMIVKKYEVLKPSEGSLVRKGENWWENQRCVFSVTPNLPIFEVQKFRSKSFFSKSNSGERIYHGFKLLVFYNKLHLYIDKWRKKYLPTLFSNLKYRL